MTKTIKIEDYIKEYKDFPQPGVTFRDVTPLLASPEALEFTVDRLLRCCPDFDVVVAPDARGFIFGTPLALHAHKPFVMARKKGKLPGKTMHVTYDLEYGTNTLEVQVGSLKPGQRVVIVDDVLATGGTINAIRQLVESAGAHVVKMIFVIEIKALGGRKFLRSESNGLIESLVVY